MKFRRIVNRPAVVAGGASTRTTTGQAGDRLKHLANSDGKSRTTLPAAFDSADKLAAPARCSAGQERVAPAVAAGRDIGPSTIRDAES